MVRDDMGEQDVTSFHRLFLLNGDYDVEIVLSLDVDENGSLNPVLTYVDPLTKVTSFMFGGSATLSETREHNFTENIQLSARKTKFNLHNCPIDDTNLAGTLGIKDLVAMAALTPNLKKKATVSGTGVFGGSIQFLVTKDLNAGPTWTLVHFTGPQNRLVNLSRGNMDKITLAFSKGPNAGKKIPTVTQEVISPNPPSPSANFFTQQLLTSSILNCLCFRTFRTSYSNANCTEDDCPAFDRGAPGWLGT
jgi:hypothetical protein